jgi:hypothetical protein
MKSLLLLSIVVLFSTGVAAQFTNGAVDKNKELQGRFVGAWKLVSLEEPGPDGRVHKADCNGMFVFTRDGKTSVLKRAYEFSGNRLTLKSTDPKEQWKVVWERY